MTASSPAVLPRRESDLRAAYWDQVRTFPDGDRVRNCIQCGSCTGSCPVSYAMDISPRQIVALFRAGFLEEILRSRSIWMCASCYACTVRCPAGIRVTDNMYALKRVASRMHVLPRHFPVHVIAEAFAGNIARFGRNWELWLVMRYLMVANPTALLSPRMQRFALAMLKRRRLGILPKRIKGVREIRAIVRRAEELGGL
jgi:heterodisulfide reductase subunit C2